MAQHETLLVAKLYPDRFTEMSPRMVTIVGYILEERFTEPAIAEMVVTSDSVVLARIEGEVGTDEMIGSEADLDRNLLALVEAAGLDEEEVREFGRLQRERIVRSPLECAVLPGQRGPMPRKRQDAGAVRASSNTRWR